MNSFIQKTEPQSSLGVYQKCFSRAKKKTRKTSKRSPVAAAALDIDWTAKGFTAAIVAAVVAAVAAGRAGVA